MRLYYGRCWIPHTTTALPQPPPEGKPPSPPLQPPVTLLIQFPTALPLLPPGSQAGEHHQCGWAGGAVKQYRSVTRTGRHHPLPVSPQVNQTEFSLSLSLIYTHQCIFSLKNIQLKIWYIEHWHNLGHPTT